MSRILLMLLIFIVTLGCEANMMMPEPEPIPDNDPIPVELTYLALGDSYTIGQGVPEKDRYPVQLLDSLKKANVNLAKLQIVARTGWTTDELSAAMHGISFDDSYSMVTLLIGVNNQYRGWSPESYRPEFVALLQRAIKLAGGSAQRVVVLSIPDWGVTPFAQGRDRAKIAAEIDAYNKINKEESEAAGVAWIDVTTISREALARPELIASDNLHPSGLMYKYWMEYLFPIAKIILKEHQP